MDVTAQPLKGEAKPPHRSPCDDFTSTVTPLDPDTPFCPTQNPDPRSLQLLVPIGPPRAAVAEGKEEWTERRRAKERREKDGGAARRGLCKRSTVGQRFLLGVRREGAGVGVCVKDHRLRF
ncbi:hypothetical protein VZT92_027732 [Zoarces viviparus]|uniref:Uncharacterized protein n=1 Tax=Zoarces viviparus TaxID=48416 RepID=A0AAW1DW10_ZOAVI